MSTRSSTSFSRLPLAICITVSELCVISSEAVCFTSSIFCWPWRIIPCGSRFASRAGHRCLSCCAGFPRLQPSRRQFRQLFPFFSFFFLKKKVQKASLYPCYDCFFSTQTPTTEVRDNFRATAGVSHLFGSAAVAAVSTDRV